MKVTLLVLTVGEKHVGSLVLYVNTEGGGKHSFKSLSSDRSKKRDGR